MNSENIEKKIQEIVEEKLQQYNLTYDTVSIRVFYDIRTVGVQGDERTYKHPVEISIKKDNEMVWNTQFIREMSTEITNKVQEINRVTYTIS